MKLTCGRTCSRPLPLLPLPETESHHVAPEHLELRVSTSVSASSVLGLKEFTPCPTDFIISKDQRTQNITRETYKLTNSLSPAWGSFWPRSWLVANCAADKVSWPLAGFRHVLKEVDISSWWSRLLAGRSGWATAHSGCCLLCWRGDWCGKCSGNSPCLGPVFLCLISWLPLFLLVSVSFSPCQSLKFILFSSLYLSRPVVNFIQIHCVPWRHLLLLVKCANVWLLLSFYGTFKFEWQK